MTTLKIKRKDVPFLIAGLAQVKGMKDFQKAISLGRDSRKLKEIQEETEAAMKACKPENYDGLLDELRKLKAQKAGQIEVKASEILNERAIASHVLLKWDKTKEWDSANKEYTAAAEVIGNEIVEVKVHTELTDKDLPKCAEDVAIAEALSYFYKVDIL